MMIENDLREKILDVLCENGVDREAVLSGNLSSSIDSLKLLELIEVLEDGLRYRIPERELTEENFSSVPALLKMVDRISVGAA
jgi:acyl carrier protein